MHTFFFGAGFVTFGFTVVAGVVALLSAFAARRAALAALRSASPCSIA